MAEMVAARGYGEAWSAVPHRTITELVWQACQRSPDLPALIFEDSVLVTYRQFLERAERFAAYLGDHLRPGDRVAIMLENRAEFMIAWLAVVANRAALVCINTAAQEFDAGHILRDSSPVMAIVGESSEGLIRRLQPECPSLQEILVVSGTEPDGLAPYGEDADRFPLDSAACERSDVTNVYYTSGTT